MSNEFSPTPWIATPDDLAENIWEYCRISHFPACGEAFRVSYVRIGPDDEAKVVTHEQSSELVCVLSGKALALAGETKRILKTHDVVFLPKNTAHAFAAIGGEATLLVVHTPAVAPNTDHRKSAVILTRPKEK
jgi:quercetin dioxygenase-like cupin family protein